MNRRIVLIIFFLFISANLLACDTRSIPTATSIAVTPTTTTASNNKIGEEKAIYRIVIQSVVSNYIQMRWLIQDRTIAERLEVADYLHEQLPEISQTTLNDYKLANREIYQLSDQFDFGREFLSQKEYEEIFQSDYVLGWDAFHAKYSNRSGYISLSRIGFNPEVNQAVVYACEGCDPLCGSGNLYFLVKEGDTWQLKKVIRLWTS